MTAASELVGGVTVGAAAAPVRWVAGLVAPGGATQALSRLCSLFIYLLTCGNHASVAL